MVLLKAEVNDRWSIEPAGGKFPVTKPYGGNISDPTPPPQGEVTTKNLDPEILDFDPKYSIFGSPAAHFRYFWRLEILLIHFYLNSPICITFLPTFHRNNCTNPHQTHFHNSRTHVYRCKNLLLTMFWYRSGPDCYFYGIVYGACNMNKNIKSQSSAWDNS